MERVAENQDEVWEYAAPESGVYMLTVTLSSEGAAVPVLTNGVLGTEARHHTQTLLSLARGDRLQVGKDGLEKIVLVRVN